MKDIIFGKENKEVKFDEVLTIGKEIYLAKNSNDVNKNRSKFDLILADKDWAFNDKRVDLICNMELDSKKDFMHHRGSGMNQVRAKQLRDNKTIYCFNFNQLLGKDKDILLGRMKQNVVLCRKYKSKMAIASFANDEFEMRDAKDLMSFGISIGMHPAEAKLALNWSTS